MTGDAASTGTGHAACRGGADAAVGLGRGEGDGRRDTEPGELRRVDKPARVRPLGAVGIEALRSQVVRLSEKVWQQENAEKENDFFCFQHTRHIVFRFIAGNRDPRHFYSMLICAVWQRMLLPVMARAAAPYGLARPVYPKVMLARLKAGHGIDRHVDGHPDAKNSHPFVHKIHVPLETNPGAVLHVDGMDFHLEAGHAWEINNLVPQGAFNGGASDRIHLIFEMFGAGEEVLPREAAGPTSAPV